MIAQLILSALLFFILLYCRIEYRQSPVVALSAMLATLLGLYFVWVPSDVTLLAAHVGVVRGVDLILYVWTVISFIILLNLHLKLRAQMELITTLARSLAIAGVKKEQQ